MAVDARLTLRHRRGETRLVVGRGGGWWADEWESWVADRRAFVVTSEPVERLHGARLTAALGAAAAIDVLRAPDGEAAKTPAVATDLWRRMSRLGGRRDSRVVAFGGGSICDLAAFVAATFLRGVEVAHVPTTALAQVDAAIGGKAAVNLPEAKNAVGAFWHPAVVVSDTELLATLPRRDLAAGLVEVVKMAALLEPRLVAELDSSWDRLCAGEAAAWAPVVAAAQRLKVDVVERDAEEAGLRRVLNFGHTLGHALESATGHTLLRHGEAVAYGIRFAYRLAARLGVPSDERTISLLARLSLPSLPPLDAAAVSEFIDRDKKAGPEGVLWVLPGGGEGWQATTVAADLVRRELADFLASGSGDC